MQIFKSYTIQENGQVTLPIKFRQKYNLKKGERLYDVYYKAEGSDHFDTMLVRARSEKAAMKKAGSVLKYSTIHDAEERP